MDFEIFGHRQGDIIITRRQQYASLWSEFCDALSSVSDEDIIIEYNSIERSSKKSISQPINNLIKERLEARGWESESFIFAEEYYQKDERGRKSGVWRLDFAKEAIAVEVSFNHRSDIAWNLIKPTLSGELNHVRKAIQTDIGIIVTATKAMKEAGGFDKACGTYEDFVAYLKPMYHVLTVPLVIVGLEAPTTFKIENKKVARIS